MTGKKKPIDSVRVCVWGVILSVCALLILARLLHVHPSVSFSGDSPETAMKKMAVMQRYTQNSNH